MTLKNSHSKQDHRSTNIYHQAPLSCTPLSIVRGMWSPRRCFENTILISDGGDVNLVEFIELEPSGIEGKDIRAELTKITRGTDIHVVCVCKRGTDGEPCGMGFGHKIMSTHASIDSKKSKVKAVNGRAKISYQYKIINIRSDDEPDD
jgi:hypothetical protein